MKIKNFDLTKGDILKNLILVSMPIMATSFIQMTHNLVDIFWLSRVSTEAVAAAGGGGMYLWLSMSLLFIGRMGAEIGVSQSIGKGDLQKAKNYAQNAIFLAITLGTLYGLLLIFANTKLVSFFNIQDISVVQMTQSYITFIGFGIPFIYLNAVMTGTYTGIGNTKLPFYINSSGLVLNIIISPIFIFVLEMYIIGAAVSTVIAQMFSFTLFIISTKRNLPFTKFNIISYPKWLYIKQIFKWGIPIALESALFTMLTMISTRFVANFGVSGLAVQRIGSQIEALSWLIGGGFASAVTAFTGQNIGSGKYSRVREGFKISIICMTIWGLITTAIMFFLARQIMGIFFHDQLELSMGISYMQILAFMQVFACLEGVAAGFFRGRGLTIYPTITSTICNTLRVILAYFLSLTPLGLNGIWIALTIGASVRGTWLISWYIFNSRKMPKIDL